MQCVLPGGKFFIQRFLFCLISTSCSEDSFRITSPYPSYNQDFVEYLEEVVITDYKTQFIYIYIYKHQLRLQCSQEYCSVCDLHSWESLRNSLQRKFWTISNIPKGQEGNLKIICSMGSIEINEGLMDTVLQGYC